MRARAQTMVLVILALCDPSSSAAEGPVLAGFSRGGTGNFTPATGFAVVCGDSPTLEQCQSEAYLESGCAAPHVTENGICSQLVEEAMLEEKHREEVSVIAKELEPAGVDYTIPETSIAAASNYTPDPYSIASMYEAVAYGGNMPAPPGPGATNFGIDLYAEWLGNGAVVHSCEEYVYERFYDINVFHRMLGTDGSKPVEVLKVAFGPLSKHESIGSRHLGSAVLRGLDGRQFGVLYDGASVAKNAFFTIPSHPYAGSEITTPKGPDLLESIANYSELGEALLATIEVNRDETTNVSQTWARAKWMWEELVYRETSLGLKLDTDGDDDGDDGLGLTNVGGGGDPSGPQITTTPDSLKELLGAVKDHPHVRRHLPDELNELYRLQERLRELISQWIDANVKYKGSDWDPDALIPDPITGGHDTIIDHAPGGDHRPPLNAANDLATVDDGDLHAADDLANIGGGGGGGIQGVDDIAIDPPTDDEETIVRRRIVKEITKVLEEAADADCLETGLTPCDWSPLAFARDMKQTFAWNQESAFNECVRLVDGIATGTDQPPTEGYLSNLLGQTYTFVPAGEEYACSISVPEALTAADLDALWPEVVNCRERQVLQEEHDTMEELAANTPLYDDATGTWKNPGFLNEGGESMGNDFFGLGYDYRYGWEVNLEGGVCDLDAWAGARLGAEATVFGYDQSLVDFEASLDTADEDQDDKIIDIHGEVFGTPVFTDIVVEEGDTEPLLDWSRSKDVGKSHDIPLIDQRFVIVVVPVRLTAGVAGRTGVEFGLDVELVGFTTDECPRLNLQGLVRPYVGVDGFVEAAVDIWIASAGIRGDLTIIEASLPFRPNVSVTLSGGEVEGNAVEPIELNLVVNSTLDLELSTLSGQVSAFAKVGFCPLCAKGKWTIVEWNGPRWSKNLATQDYQANLANLAVVYGD